MIRFIILYAVIPSVVTAVVGGFVANLFVYRFTYGEWPWRS